MNIFELRSFLIENVKNFEKPEILGEEGECYHYTPHWEKIQESNVFKGTKVSQDLDHTQTSLLSTEAEEEEGVVFAYENINDAREEGFGLYIIKIRYKSAIRALHKAEDELGRLIGSEILKLGIESEENITPKTLLILTSDILSFEFIEKV